MKRLLCVCAAFLLCASMAVVSPVAMETKVFSITGYDTAFTNNGVIIYPAGNTVRTVSAKEYGFRYAKLLIFDETGRLYEGGGDLLANDENTNGSPQTSVKIPANGFMVAFGEASPSDLMRCHATAMEGAMLYNATMSLTYDMTASYNRSRNELTINVGNPKPITNNTKKYLFIGNSSTYFNGTPIKFRALCESAGLDVAVDYCTFGSAYLYQFADETHAYGKALRSKLASEKYDYAVLQDAGSVSRIQSADAVSMILPLLEKNGAKGLLYMRYSAASTASGRQSGAEEHYRNYTSLSEKFNLPVAPVAVAFLNCTAEHPGINLYADDNSHHSREGSYLAACVWLYSFTGKSPVGNSYTAGLDAKTVAALQECAYKACTEEFHVSGDDYGGYTENGINYVNLSLGKPYTPSGAAYSGTWTDTAADGKPLGKLTDGIFADSGSSADVGCYTGKQTYITIDLGEVKTVSRIRTDLYGNTGWGIPDPDTAEVTVSFSDDGTNFSAPVDAVGSESTGGTWKKRDFICNTGDLTARYVKVGYTLTGNFCWSSEIAVYGPETKSTDSTSSESQTSGEGASAVSSENTASAIQSVYENEDESEDTGVLTVIISAVAVLGAAGLVFALIRRKKKRI